VVIGIRDLRTAKLPYEIHVDKYLPQCGTINGVNLMLREDIKLISD
jgi:hypothetical protein